VVEISLPPFSSYQHHHICPSVSHVIRLTCHSACSLVRCPTPCPACACLFFLLCGSFEKSCGVQHLIDLAPFLLGCVYSLQEHSKCVSIQSCLNWPKHAGLFSLSFLAPDSTLPPPHPTPCPLPVLGFFSGARFSHTFFSGARFSHPSFSGARFSHTFFSGARFFTSLLFWRQILHIPPFLTQDWRDSLWSCLARLLLVKLVLVGHCCWPAGCCCPRCCCPGCQDSLWLWLAKVIVGSRLFSLPRYQRKRNVFLFDCLHLRLSPIGLLKTVQEHYVTPDKFHTSLSHLKRTVTDRVRKRKATSKGHASGYTKRSEKSAMFRVLFEFLPKRFLSQ